MFFSFYFCLFFFLLFLSDFSMSLATPLLWPPTSNYKKILYTLFLLHFLKVSSSFNEMILYHHSISLVTIKLLISYAINSYKEHTPYRYQSENAENSWRMNTFCYISHQLTRYCLMNLTIFSFIILKSQWQFCRQRSNLQRVKIKKDKQKAYHTKNNVWHGNET